MTEIYLTASLVLYKPDFLVLGRTLDALQRAFVFARQEHKLHLELTLVDNSDDREWAERIEKWVEERALKLDGWKISLLNPESNLGYGRGNNLVIERVESDYHLVINPDLFLEPDALHQALDFMQSNPDVGLLVPSVFGEDGQRQYLCKRSPTLFIMFLRSFAPNWTQSVFSSVIEKFEMCDQNYEEIIEGVQYPTGCCMFFRTQLLQQIKGFDPDYFLHYEDADIGRRLSMIARIVYVPNVRVIHLWARDTHHSRKMLWITVRSGWIYWRKWGGAFRSSFGYGFTPQNIKKIEVAKSMPRKKILVTGANGFVGQHLCARLRHEGCVVRGAVRQISHQGLARDVEQFPIGSVDQHTDWSIALADVDAVIHLAARVHVMCDSAKDPLTEFRKVNVIATSNLARQAASAGVKRFIFISSIKVNGEGTPIDKPFTAEDVPAPVDPYGISKHEAEEALKKIADETGLELVIIRPVLVYGPKVKGNFKELMRWLFKEIPLPVGTINNKRSLVSLGNLADFIVTCLAHPRASNQVFLVSDGIDLSTPELLTMTALAMNKKTHLVAVPANLLCSLGELLGKKMVVQRLCESLRVDIGKNRELLGWIPPVSVEAALEETVSYYMADYDR